MFCANNAKNGAREANGGKTASINRVRKAKSQHKFNKLVCKLTKDDVDPIGKQGFCLLIKFQPSIKHFAFGISKLNYLLKTRESPDDEKLETTENKTNLYLAVWISMYAECVASDLR